MNNGMLGGAATPRLEFPQDEKYARITYDVAEGTAAGGIGTTTWTTHAFNLIERDDDNIIEKVAAGIVTVKPGRYRVRATMHAMQLEAFSCTIKDVQTDRILANISAYIAQNRLTGCLMQLEDVIDVRHARGLRMALWASTGSANVYVTGLDSYGPLLNGDRDCHGTWEFWEERDT